MPGADGAGNVSQSLLRTDEHETGVEDRPCAPTPPQGSRVVACLTDTSRRHPTLFPFVIAAAAAIVGYAPGLRSGFVSDDYAFLWAARRTDWDSLINAIAGGSSNAWATVSYNWRPLSVAAFMAAFKLFGDAETPYHLLVFAGHLTSIYLVIALANRLGAGRLGSFVAGVSFAVQPLTFGAVTWIASLNSIGLSFALASWLTVMRFARRPTVGQITAATALMVFAVSFRETAVALVPAIVTVAIVKRLEEDRPAVRPLGVALVPIAVVGIAASVVSARVLSLRSALLEQPARDTLGNAWELLERALVPVDPAAGPISYLQTAAALSLVFVVILAVAFRWWLVASLLVSFHVSLFAYATNFWGGQARYFYMPSSILALAVGAIIGEISARRRFVPWLPVAWVSAAALTVASTASLRSNVTAWVEEGPLQHTRLVEALRVLDEETHETPRTVFVANLPPSIALFDAFNLRYIEDRVWPAEDVEMVAIDISEIENLRVKASPEQRLLTFDPSGGACAAQRTSGTEPWPSFLLSFTVTSETSGDGEIALASFGPYVDDLMGAVVLETGDGGVFRLRLDIPWFPSQFTAWRQSPGDGPVEFAMLTNLVEGSYEFFVDGRSEWLVPIDYVDAAGMPQHVVVDVGDVDSLPIGVAIVRVPLSPCSPEAY